jgi:hypothetical protein
MTAHPHQELQFARDAARALHPSPRRITKMRHDPIAMLRDRRVIVSLRPLPMAGALARRGPRRLAVVDSGLSKSRQRLVAAHLLGHVVLHTDPDRIKLPHDERLAATLSDLDKVKKRSREDAEADAFAAELLMPRKLVFRELPSAIHGGLWVDERALRKLARRLDVPQLALTLRLVGMGLLRGV